jgi:phage terminase small subunit
MKPTLTDRQDRFVHEYLLDQNASAAAGRAGYSGRSKGTQAALLMKNPLVRERIVVELADLYAKLKLNAVEVLKAQIRAAYLDPAKLFDAAQEPIPLDQLDEDTRGGLTVAYAKRRGGDYTMRVRQTPRHIALAVLQKRLDAFEKLQAETFAGKVEETQAESSPPRPGQPLSELARRLLSDPAEQAPAEARSDSPDASSAEAAPAAALTPPMQPVMPVPPAQASPPPEALKPTPATDFDPDAPPSPHDPDYDFMKDPNALYGGRYTAWNKYQQEKRARELQERERQAALAQGLPPGARIGPGRTVPVRMEPGYNPPWYRNNRPEFAIGAGETYLD